MKYDTLNLGIVEAVFNKLGGMEGAKRFLRNESIYLEPLGTVAVSGTTRSFIAKEKLVCSTTPKAGIRFLGHTFLACFISGAGKVESAIREQTLQYEKLRIDALDQAIIFELGGEEKAETTLTEMF